MAGVIVDGTAVRALSQALDEVCDAAGFPPRPSRESEFKWSPGKELWMRDNLTGDAREQFFKKVIDRVRAHNASAIVVAVDTGASPAHAGKSHEMDALLMLLERFHSALRAGEEGFVVCDTPSGSRADEHGFLVDCVEALAAGTDYVKFDRLALPVLSAPSHLVRLLQVADLVTSCILAYIAGEARYAPKTAAEIRAVLRRDGNRVGGYGVKLHPDYRYGNLYHWLFGDSEFWKGNVGTPLPLRGRAYAESPDRR
ncbi:MAG: hypothetical protein M5U28_14055 [Sandaracinaceae bacterium]|nr:hypothetical protein [Sandaracinaceae bacterium]